MGWGHPWEIWRISGVPWDAWGVPQESWGIPGLRGVPSEAKSDMSEGRLRVLDLIRRGPKGPENSGTAEVQA